MKHPSWSQGAVIYEMNVRQLTPSGTLLAATEQLERLHQMGVDLIWLMPIYPIGEVNRKGELGSYYSIRDYCAVNPEFGDLNDFDSFIQRAHSLSMKVILDWVANHTARDARWITESPADWYERDEQGEALVPWDWHDTAKLNYANHDVWLAQQEAMEFWVKEHAVDGFRCDMAMLVPMEFWRETTSRLRQIKPDIFFLAEAEQTDLFSVGGFNACYAWRMHHIMNDVAQQKVRVTALREYLYEDRSEYPNWAMRMSFTSNHDENSWSGSEFERMGDAHELMAVFSFVVPRSMPLIYTGQEYGYDHSFEFFDRDPMPELSANRYTQLYERLSALKHGSAALRAGTEHSDFVEIHNNAEDCLMILVRERDGERVVAIMNMSPYVIEADYNTGIYAGRYINALTGGPVLLSEHVNEIMEPWSYKILTQ